MNQNDCRPFAAGGRPGEKTIDDFFAAAMRGVHGDDSFSHGSRLCAPGRIGNTI
jgi:hypothetical protein